VGLVLEGAASAAVGRLKGDLANPALWRANKKSIKGDRDALKLLFSQFIDERETIVDAHYYGINGLWHIGFHSFGCLTDRRICSLKIGWLGHVGYSDAFLEDSNSIRVNQPSLLALYLFGLMFITVTFGVGLLVLPLLIKLFYRFNKSGVTIYVRSGGAVYIFCDRNKIKEVNRLVRALNTQRENRLLAIFGIREKGHEDRADKLEKNLAA
jgi:hypothetical protein